MEQPEISQSFSVGYPKGLDDKRQTSACLFLNQLLF